MKTALVIGGYGLLGSALVKALRRGSWDVFWTTRDVNYVSEGSPLWADLSKPIPDLRFADVTYMVAAIANYRGCEGNAEAFRINVDGPIDVIKQALEKGSFPVFVSSDAVEWSSSAYARHKAYVETVFRMSNVAILRPGKITKETAPDCCRRLIEIGEARKSGVFHWPEAAE